MSVSKFLMGEKSKKHEAPLISRARERAALRQPRFVTATRSLTSIYVPRDQSRRAIDAYRLGDLTPIINANCRKSSREPATYFVSRFRRVRAKCVTHPMCDVLSPARGDVTRDRVVCDGRIVHLC